MSATSNTALGFIEVRHLSIAAIVADVVTKSANVNLLGLEPAGTELTLIRIGSNSSADIQSALDAAEDEASRLGGQAVTALLAKPDSKIPTLNQGPKIINGLYGGREEMKPSDFKPNRLESLKRKSSNKKNTNMSNKPKAIGILETQGLTASLAATDAMLKAADVTLVGKEKIGAAYVTIIIEGDVAAVNAAIETGSEAIGQLGSLIAAHVIARPHDDLVALLPS